MTAPWLHHPLLALKDAADELQRLAEGHLAYFRYPTRPTSRYGWGKPAHALFEAEIARQVLEIGKRLKFYAEQVRFFAEIPTEDPGPSSNAPYWNHDLLPAIDAISICGMVAEWRPRQFIEIGSGGSTRFARTAIHAFTPDSLLTSIDPYPGDTIRAIPHRMIVRALQDVELDLFDELDANDIVWMDGSHLAFSGTDAAVFFFEVVPRLRPGVIIGVHDIPLPWDYPPSWSHLYFGELMMAGAYLLGARGRTEYLFPAFYINNIRPDLRQILAPLWATPGLAAAKPEGILDGGGAFWFRHIG